MDNWEHDSVSGWVTMTNSTMHSWALSTVGGAFEFQFVDPEIKPVVKSPAKPKTSTVSVSKK